MQPKSKGEGMVHNEVNKLFCNSLVKATKDVFHMWIMFWQGGWCRRGDWYLGGHSRLQPTVLSVTPTSGQPSCLNKSYPSCLLCSMK